MSQATHTGATRPRSAARPSRSGDVLVEYAIVVAGIVLVSLAAVSVLSARVGGLVGVSARTGMPGAHPNDNGPIGTNFLVELDTGNGLALDFQGILDRSDGTIGRLDEAFGVDPPDTPFDDSLINTQYD